MNDHDQNVRLPSAGVQGLDPKFRIEGWEASQFEEKVMPLSLLQRVRPSAFDARGHLLVFAPPLIAGHQGAPLALSSGKGMRVTKPVAQRKNWAKRRAYGA